MRKGADYHEVVKKALKALARWLVAEARERGLGEAGVKVFVDTAPVMEKPLAARGRARLAGQAHQSGQPRARLLAVPRRDLHDARASRPTSRHAIAAAPAAPASACPTEAFPEPYRLDARRCISYLTIEHKGPIPHEFREAIGNRIYGCDDCLAVCPWNKFASAAQANRAFLPRAELAAPRLAELLALDDAGFRKLFSGSPIKRIGRDRFVRNCLIAAGNSGDAGLLPQVEALRTIPIRSWRRRRNGRRRACGSRAASKLDMSGVCDRSGIHGIPTRSA